MSENKTPSYDDGIAENPVFSKMKTDLNKTGCGFCLAKWTQVTMHLQLGHTHSCHHPKTHKIPLSELQRNPSALHNTRYKKRIRKEMLDGERPSECNYCWNVEDNSSRFSDRVFKSSENWSAPHLEEIRSLGWRENYNPTYVEVAFSNACNFKCSYCAPQFSSKWMEEIEKYGAYPTSDKFNDKSHMIRENKLPIPHKEHNPYVEAFWKWWPELYRGLDTFRITGGEPLMSPDTWKVLDYILEEPNPNSDLKLAINSNLGVPDKLIDRLIEKIKRLEDENRVKEFIIFTSVDTWGEQAEYTRHGLVFNKFWDNVNKVMTECNRVNLTFMVTYNALSVPNFEKLIHGVYDLKREYASPDRYWNSAVFLDSSYLRYPYHQTVQVLPDEFGKYLYTQTQLSEYYATPSFDRRLIGYSDIEVQKIKRIHDWMMTDKDPEELLKKRQNFYRFFNAHDERRGTDFKKVFPEFSEFYDYCKSLC